jgi:eukaryotic-like serine/threonine-protein kinase
MRQSQAMVQSPDRWATVERLYHATLAQPVERRAAFLTEACAGDEELRREVESLLAASHSGDHALTHGAVTAAAALVSDIGQSVLIGRRIGAYQILGPLGTGGMGEVYRARDTRLGREVAIKILPRAFTADADRLARFEREARVLASLNHPHIAAIHGIEDAPTDAGQQVRALVLELVEGETLAERIARTSSKGLPIKDALDVARQIADALDAAHEKGIVHRDLKPANIKITPQGVVKVLDFGLAKLETASGDSADRVTDAPTITVNDTRDGLIVGTAAYMSPEQARGLTVDKRTDVWAFGCVLYEMLAGCSAFARETVTDTIAAIIEREPDWSALPQATSAALHHLLRRTLQKDPRERLRDVADARFILADVATGAWATSTSAVIDRGHATTGSRRAHWRAYLAWVLAAIAAMTLTAVFVRRPSAVIEPQVTRFEIATPPATSDGASLMSFAVSPDSRQIVFVAVSDGVPKLWLRRLDQSSARPLPATDNALYPFWAPDEQAVGFFADGTLKRADLGDGSVRALARAPNARGGTWSADGVILYSPALNTPLFRIDASGGRATAVTHLEQTGHSSHRHPQFLPDGRRFIFSGVFGSSPSGVYLSSLDGSEPRRLINGSYAEYVTPGYLLTVEQSVLLARRLDLESLKVSEPQTLAQEVGQDLNGRRAFSVSPGMLANRTGGSERLQLAWFDRSGRRLRAVGPVEPTQPINVELSPDGRYAAIARGGGPRDVWLIDTERDVATRLTTDPPDDFSPVWSPDGNRVAFRSDRDGQYNLFEVPAIGGTERRIFQSPQQKTPLDWSRDGRFVLYAELNPAGGSDLFAVTVTGDEKPAAIAQTQFDERDGQFAPNNRRIAYASDESGRYEVYVQPFPARGAKIQTSIGGGIGPRWRGDGKELFYVAPDGTVMSVPLHVDAVGNTIEPGVPVRLFRPPMAYGGLIPSDGSTHQQYAVTGDGQRFLVNTVVGEPTAPPIRIVLNWQAALKDR